MLSMTIFPQIAILGALYTMFSGFHIIGPLDFPKLYDSLWALVFSYLIFTLPFTIWVLTSFMRALPGDLEEAAYVDGATPLQVFWKVLLPLIAPGLVTTGLLAFISAWNEYLYAVSFIQSPDHYTVPVAISSFTGSSGNAFQFPGGGDGRDDRGNAAADRGDSRPAATDPGRTDRGSREGLDAGASLGVEEVEPGSVDRELDLLTQGDAGFGLTRAIRRVVISSPSPIRCRRPRRRPRRGRSRRQRSPQCRSGPAPRSRAAR